MDFLSFQFVATQICDRIPTEVKLMRNWSFKINTYITTIVVRKSNVNSVITSISYWLIVYI